MTETKQDEKQEPIDYAKLLTNVWRYVRNSTWTDLEVAKTYNDRVYRFIAEESARIAREEEAVNFVPVPWQDVAWLSNGGASVQYLDDEIRKWVEFPCQFNASGRSRCSYRADRRTFPAGYDPTKPRWVTVSTIDDLDRLRAAGATARTVEVSLGYLCQVDIHTLPPGVPLHVEAEKLSVVKSGEPMGISEDGNTAFLMSNGEKIGNVSRDGGVMNIRTFRPCTREFALSHPAESEYRFKGSAATEWHQWQPMSDFMYGTVQYEFRTTAPEEKRDTVEFDYEHSVNRCLRIEDGPRTISAIIPPSEMTTGKWHLVATRVK